MKGSLAIFAVLLFSVVCVCAAEDHNLAQSYYHFSLAQWNLNDGKIDKAFEHFARAVEYNPEDDRLRTAYAEVLVMLRRLGPALAECEKALEINPKNAAAHLILANVYFQTNRIDEAVESAKRSIEFEPDSFRAFYLLATIYDNRGQFDEALEAYDRVTYLKPDAARAHHSKAKVLKQKGRFEEALESAERADRISGGGDLDFLGLLGELYERNNRVKEAVETYRSILGQRLGDPRHLQQVRFRLGSALTDLRRFDEAVEILQEFLKAPPAKESPLYLEANYNLARSLSGIGERDRAIALYTELANIATEEQYRDAFEVHLALLYQDKGDHARTVDLLRSLQERHPENPAYLLRLAFALEQGGRDEEALKISEDLNEAAAKDPDIAISRAQLLSDLGKVDEALRILNDLVDQGAGGDVIYSAMGQLLIDHKRFGDAEAAIKRGLDLHQGSENLQFQLAAVYERQKNFERAEEQFRKILDRNPTNHPALNYLGYMLADIGIQLDEALMMVQKAVDSDPFNGAYLDSLGWVYFRLGKLDLAEMYLTKAVRVTDDDPTIFEHLGDLYARLERFTEARSNYEASLKFATEDEERQRAQQKLQDLQDARSPGPTGRPD